VRVSHQLLIAQLGSLLRPRPRRNIWQWADESRFLQKGVSDKSQHGDTRYRSADAPHQRAMQEAPTDKAVQITVIIGASQIMGKTEVINNVIGYHMDYRPTSTVVMYPTTETAEKFSKKKLTPAINASPCLSDIISSRKSRDTANTILTKDFLGGSIYIVGSNSTSALRGASGAVLIGDEIDDYEEDIGGQGDPVELLWKRGESYPEVVKILSSTPTIEGVSRIWGYFEDSDRQFWFMPCVHCGKKVIFKWSLRSKIEADIPCAIMHYDPKHTEGAELVCQECFNPINDQQRLDMYYAGGWEPTAGFNGIRGFHLNWLYCPWKAHKGFKNRLHEFAEEWERAKKKGTNSLKVIINTGLAECFAEEYEKAPDWEALLLRLEPYENEVPEPVVYLTCAIDVQSDRLEYEVLGWAEGEESYGIDTGKIFGSPHSSETWERCENVLARTFDHPSGARLKISCTLIDSGGQSDNRAFALPVYKFVRRRQSRFVFASKGSSVIGAPLVVGHLQKNGIMLQQIGTDVCKSTVYDWIKIDVPGPRYCHFPKGRGYDEEWFKQLTSEQVTQTKVRGSTKRIWVKRRARNEALDLRAGNHAAFEIRNPNLAAIGANLRKAAEAMKPLPLPPEEPFKIQRNDPPAPVKPAPRLRRRLGFANWK
jgi:phage terminase large subunit GpA-like protein